MHPPFDLSGILLPNLNWAEVISRPILVYVIILVVLRLGGRHTLAQTTIFDFVVILLISNVVQNAMIGTDVSVLGAGVGAFTLVLLSMLLDFVSARSVKARAFFLGRSEYLIVHGALRADMMRRRNVALADIRLAVRKAGLSRLEDVEFAVLELDGTISVIPHSDKEDERPHTALPLPIPAPPPDRT